VKRVVVVDDSDLFSQFLLRYMGKHYPALDVATFNDPEEALSSLDPSMDLCILDWEMPKVNGAEFLERAVEKGLARNKVVILSSHAATDLHDRFSLGTCLAVLEKYECLQRDVLDMLLREVEGEGK